MLRNSRQSPSSSIFWPADKVDAQSTVSSPVQPVIDAGKQRRRSVQLRPALGDLLFRRPNSASPPKLLPEKFEIPQTSQAVDGRGDYHSRSVCSPPQPKWTRAGSTKEAPKILANRSCSDDGCPYWCQSSDENSRRNSIELYGTLRRSSEPSSALAKCSSATSLSSIGRNADRRRPWISKYLQQFAETADDREKPTPRRKGSVAALINSFEQCTLQHGTLKPPQEPDLRGGLVRRTFHGSLTNFDSVGRSREWSSNPEKAVDSNCASTARPSDRMDLNLTNSPSLTRQVPRLESYGIYVKTWKARNDHATVDGEAANIIRRSSVDVIRKALHGSLTNLDAVGRSGGSSTSSEKAAHSGSTTTSTASTVTSSKSPPLTRSDHVEVDNEDANTIRRTSVDVIRKALRGSLTNLDAVGRSGGWSTSSEKAASSGSSTTTSTASSKSPPLTRSDHVEVDNEDANTIRRSSSFNVVTPAALCISDYTVSFNPKPAGPSDQPIQQRRLTVLVGTGRTNHSVNTDRNAKSTPLTTNIRGKPYAGNFAGTVDQQEAGYSCESGGAPSPWLENAPGFHCRSLRSPGENRQETSDSYESESGSTLWASRHTPESLPTPDTRCDNTSNWVQKLVPSFGAVDDGGDFESAWQYDGTSPRRPGSLVSDSNNTEDSGVALSEYASPMVDWSRADQETAQNAGVWWRCRSKSGNWMTYRGDEDEKSSNTGYSTSPSQEHSDIKLAQHKFVLHGKRTHALKNERPSVISFCITVRRYFIR